MDLSDVGVRHAVAFSNLNIRHSLDVSPATVSLAKELRYCVIAIVLGVTAASIVGSLVNHYSRASKSREVDSSSRDP